MNIINNNKHSNFSITTLSDTDIFTFTLQYFYLEKLKKLVNEYDGIMLHNLFNEMFDSIYPYLVNNTNIASHGNKQALEFLQANKSIIKACLYKELSNIANSKYKLILNIPDNIELFKKDPWLRSINLILNIFFIANQDRVSYAVGGFNIITIGNVKENKERRVFNLNKISSKVTKC